MVKVSCETNALGNHHLGSHREYNFDLDRESINRITCFNGETPSKTREAPNEQWQHSCDIDQNEMLECAAGSSYIVEMFDMAQKRIRGIDSGKSIGLFTVTQEMTECLVDDYLQIHFEYGKR